MIVGMTGIHLKEEAQTKGKMKTFKEFVLENIRTSDAPDINILIEFLSGKLNKSGKLNELIPLAKKIQKVYPIQSKNLFRAIRIPNDVIKDSPKNFALTKPGVKITSWTENFKTALDIFNSHKFYDPLENHKSIIVKSKIDSSNIVFNYKTLYQYYMDQNIDGPMDKQFKMIYKKYKNEKEYVVYNPSELFSAKIVYFKD